MPQPLPSRPSLHQRGVVVMLLLMVLGAAAASLALAALNGPQRQTERERRTLLAMAEAREALLGFAATHGRLPRPASSPADGRENPAACPSEAACSGFLPWVTLGVRGTDGWNKLLRYSVTPSFTQLPISPRSNVADKVVMTRDAGGRVVYLAGHAGCSLDAQCLPVVLLSQGRQNLGVSADGLPQANGSSRNSDEVVNNSAANGFFSRPLSEDSDVPGGDFDDLVSWIPTSQLFLRMYRTKVLY